MALLLYAISPQLAADDQRLAAAADDRDGWLTYGHGYTNQRYSGNDQVNRDNVANLKPAWIYQTGVLGTFPVNPLVVDGVMYLSTPFNHVVALDAATGSVKWRYDHALREQKLCCGSHNRGLAWGYGRLFMITADGRFVALNANDGSVAWDIPVVDPATGNPADLDAIRRYDPNEPGAFDTLTRFAGNMAPVVQDGRVFIGVSGTGYSAVLEDAESDSASVLGRPGVRRGLRAFMSAYDANDGSLLWRWYSTANEGWEGEFVATTAFGDDLNRDLEAERAAAPGAAEAWRGGGGSIYSSPSIDTERGLLIFGTGNASPPYADIQRPGDNLYTASVVALDVETGALRWYHQLVPHDIWGYDAASPPVLIDVPDDSGTKVPALAIASKSGWLYVLDRRTGTPLRRSRAFVPQNENMFKRPTPEGLIIAPGAGGGANWPPSAWHPGTGLVYVPASHQPTRHHTEIGPDGKPINVLSFVYDIERWGVLSAIDPASGLIRWQTRSSLPMISGALATAGGLVFAGESNGDFSAFDAGDGRRLWRFATGAGVNAPPVTYRVDGRQYVAVAAGGHALFRFPQGDAVIAFALPE